MDALKFSRRKLISTLGKTSVALPLAYPLSGLAKAEEKVEQQGALTKTNQSNFLIRDFSSSKLELVRLLKEITEVEHSLMLQYLYAGFSIKSDYEALIGNGMPDSNTFVGVAVQEMQHLGAINRLLVELGSKPHLGIQDFPYESDIYPFAMDLEPLSQLSAAKYACCEAPASVFGKASMNDPFANKVRSVLGSESQINHVGSVYEVVVELFEKTFKEEKSIAIDRDYWLAQLKKIMHEGEEDHFQFFKSVFMGDHPALSKTENVWLLDQGDSKYPSYSGSVNPTAYIGHKNEIDEPIYQSMAWLANLHYWTVLVLLDFYYRQGSNDAKYMAITNMLSPLKTLGSALAKAGYGIPFDQLSVGYNPCVNDCDNLEFSIHLLAEAELVRNKIESALPSDYPDMFESKMITQLKTYSASWRGNTVRSSNKKTFMSFG